MASIGIIANPSSGKDIRRLVSYATTISNAEKANIVMRIILAAQAMGITDVYLMPDSANIGRAAVSEMSTRNCLNVNIHELEFTRFSNAQDSIRSAILMEEAKVGCIVTLGGDGTNRCVAKYIHQTPLLPVSTGTNNVYPGFCEGTSAGLAAAIVALTGNLNACCLKDKRIDIYRNGEFTDIALIDAVICNSEHMGSRAIWDMKTIDRIIVSRCSPASIGFSAIPGCMETVRDTDDYGYVVSLEENGKKIFAPVAAGVLEELSIGESRRLVMGETYFYTAEKNCMIAVDGEREVEVHAGDRMGFVVRKNGPNRVLVRQTIEFGRNRGLFYRN